MALRLASTRWRTQIAHGRTTAGGGDTDDATGTYGNVRGPDDEIYRRKREPKKPKPPDLSKDLQQMMYGFGDSQEVDAESVEMVERLVRQYIDELLGEASAIASIRRCPLDSGCLLYAVRHDRLKFERARRLLEMKEVIRDARKKTEEVDDID